MLPSRKRGGFFLNADQYFKIFRLSDGNSPKKVVFSFKLGVWYLLFYPILVKLEVEDFILTLFTEGWRYGLGIQRKN